MPFCSNCGFKISEAANFCPQCGTPTEAKQTPAAPKPLPPLPEQGKTASTTEPVAQLMVDQTFTLVEVGEVFQQHYRIDRILNKENDGTGYIATDLRNDRKCYLKLYYQSYFDSVDKLFGSIIRMSKIKEIKHPSIAKVYEVNQTSKPAYIVSEFVAGDTLAVIRERSPEQLNEELIRELIKMIIDVGILIRRAGLSLHKLELNGIVLNENKTFTLLSSGINYDAGDEREDIFNLGIVFAKLLSKSPFYNTTYTALRMREKKFEYISGISKGMNHVLAECLHRNISQRYDNLEKLKRDIDRLKPISEEELYLSDEGEIAHLETSNKMEVPKGKFDVLFIVIAVLVMVMIGLMLTTNLMDTVFGNKKAPLQFTGFMGSLTDTTQSAPEGDLDNYRKIKTSMRSVKFRSAVQGNQNSAAPQSSVSPDVLVPRTTSYVNRTTTEDVQLTRNSLPTKKKTDMPDNFVYLNGNTFAFGSLRKDSRDNVSINSFYISKTEVTQAEWNRLMKPADVTSVGDILPVDRISWFDAILYCNSRSDAEGLSRCYKISGFGDSKVASCDFKVNGYRLPTEAEWEYAAKSGKMTSYSGSELPDQIAWYKDNSNRRLHPVKSKSANSFGLYDLTGNVSEWVWDWFDLNYQKVMPFINPTGPDIGTYKVVRGGSVDTGAGNSLQVTFRAKADPDKSLSFTGFRLVRTK
jgi:formylglycine-generating enzyme required for sulfatase activity